MSNPTIGVRLLHPAAQLPCYAHTSDAGADLCSVEQFTIAPGERALIPTGIALEIPEGYAGFVHPRSGLAVRAGVTVLNAPGTIDAGYRGQVMVALVNTDRSVPAVIGVGDRIAQLVIQQVAAARFVAVSELSETARDVGGFGSTGGFTAEGH